MQSLIYKIATDEQWREAQRLGVFEGAPIDRADGFIHFSTAEQVEETAAKHFARQIGLLLITVDAERLGPDLRWETSRGGALFPHLYASLDLAMVVKVELLLVDEEGRQSFPDGFPC